MTTLVTIYKTYIKLSRKAHSSHFNVPPSLYPSLSLSAHIYSAQYLSSFILQGHPRHPGMNNISSSSAFKSCESSLAHCLFFHFSIQDCPIHPLIHHFSHPSLLYASNLPCMPQNLKSVFICQSAAGERALTQKWGPLLETIFLFPVLCLYKNLSDLSPKTLESVTRIKKGKNLDDFLEQICSAVRKSLLHSQCCEVKTHLEVLVIKWTDLHQEEENHTIFVWHSSWWASQEKCHFQHKKK